MIKERDKRKAQQMTDAREVIKRSFDGSETPVTAAPFLDDQDVDFLAQTKVKLRQKDILKMYVGNWADLDLKQRRKVMAHIQAQRSKHAKQIFLKELSGIGRKLDR